MKPSIVNEWIYYNMCYDIIEQLLQKYIDQFGTKEHPIPPSCLISVYSTNSTDTVPVLHYGIPLKGINPPVTVYIHRALRTIGQHSIEGNIIIMNLSCSAIRYYISTSISFYWSYTITTSIYWSYTSTYYTCSNHTSY